MYDGKYLIIVEKFSLYYSRTHPDATLLARIKELEMVRLCLMDVVEVWVKERLGLKCLTLMNQKLYYNYFISAVYSVETNTLLSVWAGSVELLNQCNISFASFLMYL